MEDVRARILPILEQPPKKIGVYNNKTVYLYHNKNKYYLKYDNLVFTIPEWAIEPKISDNFTITHPIEIIE
jgi:hypothetical protein